LAFFGGHGHFSNTNLKGFITPDSDGRLGSIACVNGPRMIAELGRIIADDVSWDTQAASARSLDDPARPFA